MHWPDGNTRGSFVLVSVHVLRVLSAHPRRQRLQPAPASGRAPAAAATARARPAPAPSVRLPALARRRAEQGTITGNPQVAVQGQTMPLDDWVTRHPELVHWLHRRRTSWSGMRPSTISPFLRRSSRSGCCRFLSCSPPAGTAGPPRHQWASMDCLYSQADIATRSYWIPGSWHLRMVYTDDILCHDPSQESKRAGQHQESHR